MHFLPGKRTILVLLAVLAVACWAPAVWAYTITPGSSQTVNFTGTPSNQYSVSATFTLNSDGTQLTIDLANTATVTTDAVNVLTALLWSNTQGAGGTPLALTPISDMVPGGSTVLNFDGTINTPGTDYIVPSGGMSAQSEWGYGIKSQFGANQWVSSFDGPTTVFSGGQITGPAAVPDGLDWGLVGTNGLTGDRNGNRALPLVENSMEFVFGLPSAVSSYSFDNLSAQYGTGFDEPNLSEGGIIINPVPVPPAALLLGSGLLGMGLIGWRRREKKA